MGSLGQRVAHPQNVAVRGRKVLPVSRDDESADTRCPRDQCTPPGDELRLHAIFRKSCRASGARILTGQPSRRVSIDKIMEFNPDKIILMPCGFDINRTSKEAKALENNDKWKSLQAVRRNEVYAVNANAYFSKPGPRIVVGLEILAKIINPVTFAGLELPANSFKRITK